MINSQLAAFTILAEADGGQGLTLWLTIQQLLVVALGSLLGFLGALLVAARTEWFRKLAGWEPYAAELWKEKLVSYKGVLCASSNLNSMITAVAYCYAQNAEEWSGDGNAFVKSVKGLGKNFVVLVQLLMGGPLFISPTFTKRAIELASVAQDLLILIKAGPPTEQGTKQAKVLAGRADSIMQELTKLAHESLGVPHYEQAWSDSLRQIASGLGVYADDLTAPNRPQCTGSESALVQEVTSAPDAVQESPQR